MRKRIEDIPVSRPAPGPFNLTALHQETYTYYQKKFTGARIPSDRLQDFLAGEEKRGVTEFRILHGTRPLAEGATIREYHCCYGPEDYRGNIFVGPKPKGQRVSRKDRGKSIKRGCKAGFTAIQRAGVDWLELRLRLCHANHGPAIDEPGRHTSAPLLSKQAKEWAAQQLALGVKKTTILQENRKRHYEEYMAAHGLTDIAVAQQRMEEADGRGLPRDFYLGMNDLSNIEAAARRRAAQAAAGAPAAGGNATTAAAPPVPAAQPASSAAGSQLLQLLPQQVQRVDTLAALRRSLEVKQAWDERLEDLCASMEEGDPRLLELLALVRKLTATAQQDLGWLQGRAPAAAQPSAAPPTALQPSAPCRLQPEAAQ